MGVTPFASSSEEGIVRRIAVGKVQLPNYLTHEVRIVHSVQIIRTDVRFIYLKFQYLSADWQATWTFCTVCWARGQSYGHIYCTSAVLSPV